MDPIFYNIFEQLPRVGPGNNESTRKAFNMITSAKPLPKNPSILDIGSGTGLHTIQLAKLTDGKITALDNHQPFIDGFKQKIDDQNLSGKIQTVKGDMGAMTFENQSFDVIWAEGSIFIIGFENGLKQWRKYLKPGGRIALTDIFWFKPNPPEKLGTFFENQCPWMVNYEEASRIIDRCGYNLTGHFLLPENAWWDDFYSPLEEQLKIFREKHAGNPDALGIIEALQTEIDLFRQYSEYYGYIFFIMELK